MNAKWCVIIWLFTLFTGFAQQREGWIESKSSHIYYKFIGTGDPVVIIHGGPGFDHHYLFDGLKFLGENNMVIFYDQAGAGNSFPYLDSSVLSIGSFVEDLESLRIGLGIEKMHLLGHSFGGLIAMKYAIKHQNRLRSLTLLSSAGAKSGYDEQFRQTIKNRRLDSDIILMNELQQGDGFKNHDPTIRRKYYGLFFKAYYHNQETLSDDAILPMATITSYTMDFVYDHLKKDLGEYDLLNSLSQLRIPTLIIHGLNDPIPSSVASQSHTKIRDSRLIFYEDCGHMPYDEQPKRLRSDLLQFFNQN